MGKHIDPVPSHMPMESPDIVDDATVEDDNTVEQDTESPNVLEMGDTGIGNSMTTLVKPNFAHSAQHSLLL